MLLTLKSEMGFEMLKNFLPEYNTYVQTDLGSGHTSSF